MQHVNAILPMQPAKKQRRIKRKYYHRVHGVFFTEFREFTVYGSEGTEWRVKDANYTI